MGLGLVLAAWAVATLARVPLLDRPLPPDAVPRPFGLVALLGVPHRLEPQWTGPALPTS